MKSSTFSIPLALAIFACRAPDFGRGPASPALLEELRGDPGVEARLETRNARTAETARGAILRLDLHNKSEDTVDFVWAVEWFDRSGRRVARPASAWTTMRLAAGETREIEVPVPSPDATSWRLRAVRPG